jgi:hypothetical protein
MDPRLARDCQSLIDKLTSACQRARLASRSNPDLEDDSHWSNVLASLDDSVGRLRGWSRSPKGNENAQPHPIYKLQSRYLHQAAEYANAVALAVEQCAGLPRARRAEQ